MKKKKQKRFLIFCAVVLAAVVAVTAWFFLFERDGLPLTILDGEGNVLIQLSSPEDYAEDPRRAYFDIVIDEALSVLSQQIGEKKAQEKLWIQGYVLHTAFDAKVFEAVQIAEKTWTSSATVGIAVTDLQGNLVAAYSNAPDGVNHATAAKQPHSSLKPLSVYMQAIESGKANWVTHYEDAPYKVLETEEGDLQNWPANATGGYSMEKVSIPDAIKQSLNTVAVKCLADVGVNASVSFLQEKLGLPLTYESKMSEVGGEEEVIGNIALGSLAEGVSAVDMAGYYQIFAAKGKYIRPQALLQLKSASGEVLYSRRAESVKVISYTTAAIMNLLLQGVVDAGGTGEKAYCEGVTIAGKTGTGDGFVDNWFVGVTPQYSCAVWHGQEESNRAPELFGSVIRELYREKPEAKKDFDVKNQLRPVLYCTDSGYAIGKQCTTIAEGWFGKEDVLQQCYEH